jgi:hypothetical protein
MALDDSNKPPVIMTEHGPVTEWCRKQAALNMARDPALLARMIAQFGEAQIRRNYPEVFEGNDAAEA